MNFHLFARNLHPELFEVCKFRSYQRDQYELNVSITTDGHVISFQQGGLVVSETNAAAHHPLPSHHLLMSHPIGAKYREETVIQDSIAYRVELQMETVPPQMFATIAQQLDSQIECEGLVHRFGSNGRVAFGALSYINVQSFRQHVLVRALHTFPDTCAVLKSESRFSLIGASE